MTARRWHIRIPASAKICSVNQEEGPVARRNRKSWRRDAYDKIRDASIPTGLTRIRVDVEIRFPAAVRRDNSNYHNIAKPIVDALGPERRTIRGQDVIVSKGHGIIADDSAKFLHCADCPHITFGDPVGADPRWPYGLVTLTVTDLSGEVTT